jgi:integrase
VVKVKLSGLKIAHARGKYYVYRRADGECLLKGFEGDVAALRKRLAQPDIIGAYNVGRKRVAYPDQSLGWLVAWFTDPDKCEHFKKLAEATQRNYNNSLAFLEPLYDTPLISITTPDLYAARDEAGKQKWPAFGAQMISALSIMFKLAVQRGWMPTNPALGVEKAYKPDKNANREWRPEEWDAVMARVSLQLRVAYMLARHIGYRSQSIVKVGWKHYKPDARFGKCFRFEHRKNGEAHWLPASPALQEFLAGLTVRTKDGPIALRFNGKPWDSEAQLQKQSSNFLAKLTRQGVIEPGLTLHGLRVTFAAEAKRVIGTYDYGWPSLAASTLAKKSADTPLLETGALRDSIQWNSSGNIGHVGSDLDKAVWQEFGTSRIPPRPFLAGAAMAMEPKIHDLFKRAVMAVALGKGLHSSEMAELLHLLHIIHHVGHEVNEVAQKALDGPEENNGRRR